MAAAPSTASQRTRPVGGRAQSYNLVGEISVNAHPYLSPRNDGALRGADAAREAGMKDEMSVQ